MKKVYKLKSILKPVYGPMNGEYADRQNRPPKPKRGPNFMPKRKKKK
jgi:hypothetical protein